MTLFSLISSLWWGLLFAQVSGSSLNYRWPSFFYSPTLPCQHSKYFYPMLFLIETAYISHVGSNHGETCEYLCRAGVFGVTGSTREAVLPAYSSNIAAGWRGRPMELLVAGSSWVGITPRSLICWPPSSSWHTTVEKDDGVKPVEQHAAAVSPGLRLYSIPSQFPLPWSPS